MMSNGNKTSSLPRLPVELWVEILRHAEPSPLQLIALRDSFRGPAGAQPILGPLAIAAQANELMKPYITPDEYEAARMDARSRQAADRARPPTLLARFESDLASLPKAARLHVKRVGQCRRVLQADKFFYDKRSFDLTVKCLEPGQAKNLLKECDGEIQKSKTSALLAVHNDPQSFQYFSAAIRDDDDVKSRALAAWPPNWQVIPEFQPGHLSIYADALTHNPLALCGLNRKYKRLYGQSLQHDQIPQSLRTPELLAIRKLSALVEGGQITPATQIESLSDRNRALALTLHHSHLGGVDVHLVPEQDSRSLAQLQHDRSYIRELLPLCQRASLDNPLPRSLQQPWIFRDKEFVLLALRNRFYDKRLVLSAFCDDFDVALAGAQYLPIYDGLTRRLQADKTIAGECLAADRSIFGRLSAEAQQHFDIVKMAVSYRRENLFKMKPEARQNRDLVLRLCRTYDFAIDAFWKEYTDDEELVRIAAIRDPQTYLYASRRLRRDEEFFISILKEVSQQRRDEIYRSAYYFMMDRYRIDKRVEGLSPWRAEWSSWLNDVCQLHRTVPQALKEFLQVFLNGCYGLFQFLLNRMSVPQRAKPGSFRGYDWQHPREVPRAGSIKHYR